MASAFANRFAEALERPGNDNLLAILDRVKRGTASDRDLAEYRSLMAEFKQWKTSACQVSPSVAA